MWKGRVLDFPIASYGGQLSSAGCTFPDGSASGRKDPAEALPQFALGCTIARQHIERLVRETAIARDVILVSLPSRPDHWPRSMRTFAESEYSTCIRPSVTPPPRRTPPPQPGQPRHHANAPSWSLSSMPTHLTQSIRGLGIHGANCLAVRSGDPKVNTRSKSYHPCYPRPVSSFSAYGPSLVSTVYLPKV